MLVRVFCYLTGGSLLFAWPYSFGFLTELPLNIIRRWIGYIDYVLGTERHFRAEAQVSAVTRFASCRLVIQNPNVLLADAIRHNDPHPLSVDDDFSVVVLSLYVKNEPSGITSLQICALLNWRDPKVFRIRPV